MLRAILNKPFPRQNNPRGNLFLSLVFGGFVFGFLQFFQPFGLIYLPTPIWRITLGYGLITFFAMIFTHLVTPRLFPFFYNEDRWTVGRELVHIMGTIALIAFANALYSSYLGFFSLSIQAFGRFMGFTLAIGIFPIIIMVLVRQNKLQKEHYKQALQFNDKIEQTRISSENKDQIDLKDEEGRVMLSIKTSRLVLLESADNYVQVFYLDNGAVASIMIRNTLKFF